MREIVETSKFRSDLKRISKSGRCEIDDLLFVIHKLSNDIPLPFRFHDHALSSNWSNFRECHIKPDWLLIYKLEPEILRLVRTGSHNDLF